FPHLHVHDGRRLVVNRVADAPEFAAHLADHLTQVAKVLRFAADQVQGGADGRHAAGRHAGRENQLAGVVLDVADHTLFTRDEATQAGERLAERAHHHVDFLVETVVLRGAATGWPDDTNAVGVVDENAQAVLLLQLDDLGQAADGALHAEDAVGDQQLAGFGRRVL